MDPWTKEDSHTTFKEAQTIALQIGDMANNPTWVANYIIQLVMNDVADMNQTPCDTCQFNVDDACVEENCPY